MELSGVRVTSRFPMPIQLTGLQRERERATERARERGGEGRGGGRFIEGMGCTLTVLKRTRAALSLLRTDCVFELRG